MGLCPVRLSLSGAPARTIFDLSVKQSTFVRAGTFYVLYLLSELWGEYAGTRRALCPIRFAPAFGDCRLSAFGLASLAANAPLWS